MAFAERLGPLTLGHPTLASPPGQPFLEEIDSRRAAGPTTGTPTSRSLTGRLPFTLLHAVVIPPVGGDTIWANTVTAYQSLPAELRDLADRLRIVHTNDYDYAAMAYREERADAVVQAQAQGVRVDRLRDRAPGGPRAPGDRRSARSSSAGSPARWSGSRRRRAGT